MAAQNDGHTQINTLDILLKKKRDSSGGTISFKRNSSSATVGLITMFCSQHHGKQSETTAKQQSHAETKLDHACCK
jgi:hypothetical protein